MPEVFWKEISDIQHEIKGTLVKTAGIEKLCKKIRKEVVAELDKLDDIILRQANGDK